MAILLVETLRLSISSGKRKVGLQDFSSESIELSKKLGVFHLLWGGQLFIPDKEDKEKEASWTVPSEYLRVLERAYEQLERAPFGLNESVADFRQQLGRLINCCKDTKYFVFASIRVEMGSLFVGDEEGIANALSVLSEISGCNLKD